MSVASVMAQFGGFLLLVGLIALFFVLRMDTSVATGFPSYERVNNLGLMNEKQNYTIAAGVVAVIGAILLAIGAGKRQHS